MKENIHLDQALFTVEDIELLIFILSVINNNLRWNYGGSYFNVNGNIKIIKDKPELDHMRFIKAKLEALLGLDDNLPF